MMPEAELERRILELRGMSLDIGDIHAFLRETAELLGSPPVYVTGPEVRFYWKADERLIELSPSIWRNGGEVTVQMQAFDSDGSVVNDWRLTFEYADGPGELPYIWYRTLTTLPPEENYWQECWQGFMTSTWEQFEGGFQHTIDNMADDVALTPEEWRGEGPSLTWSLGGHSPWDSVTFTADAAGTDIVVDGYGRLSARLPRGARVQGQDGWATLTRLMAGLARPGAPALVTDLGSVEATGMELLVSMPADPVNATDPHWDRAADGSEDEADSLLGCSWEEYVRATDPPEPPQFPGKREEAPLDIRLDAQQTVDLVEALISCDDAQDVLLHLGAAAGPGDSDRTPFVSPQGWSATVRPAQGLFSYQSVKVYPCARPEDAFFDQEESLAHALALAAELERRYGAPIKRCTGSHGYISPVFNILGQGVKLSMILDISLDISRYHLTV
ncbi:MAG: hypothetical protein Q4E00_10930 [Actinomyces bowdenii]|nr:hypothetical protein [Actinomyces bowdenii]